MRKEIRKSCQKTKKKEISTKRKGKLISSKGEN
jgi:hypothetical protein